MQTSVYISDEYVYAATGSASSKGLDIERYALGQLPAGTMLSGLIADEEALRATISALWDGEKLPRRDVRLAINAAAVNQRRVKLPIVPEKRLTQMIPNEFLNLENRDSLIYDYFVLDPDDGTVLVTAAERKLVKLYMKAFKQCGIELSGMDISVSAMVKLAKYTPISGETCVIAMLDSRACDAMLFVGGRYYFYNRTRLNTNRETPENMVELARMLSSMIQFNTSEKTGSDVAKIYLAGVRESEQNLCEDITAALGITTDLFPVSERVTRRNGGVREPMREIGEAAYVAGNLIR